MARNLVPIKVKIELDDNGRHLYPNFNKIDAAIRKNLDWSKYVDIHGLGWHYDKSCGHKEHTSESPYGCQFGMLVVPKDFALAAIKLYPKLVAKLTEAQCSAFHDNKAHAHEPDEEIDTSVLDAIKAKKDLNLSLTKQQTDALDPANDVRGIRKNKKKKWADYKKLTGVTIV